MSLSFRSLLSCLVLLLGFSSAASAWEMKAAGSKGIGLALVAPISWETFGDTINMQAAAVRNLRANGSSGTLRLQVWATTSPPAGDGISGYILGTYTMNPLPAGTEYQNIDVDVSYSPPPRGTYYTTMTLSEFDGDYFLVDYITFNGTTDFGGGKTPVGCGAASDGAGTGADGLVAGLTLLLLLAATRRSHRNEI